MKDTSLAAFVFSMLLSLVASNALHADIIVWTVGAISASDGDVSDVSTNGTLVEAVNFGADTSSTTLNGVTFEAFADGGDNLTTTNLSTQVDQSADGIAYSQGNTSYDSLLDGFIHDNLASEITYTLTGLTSGLDYEVQLFLSDDRNAPAAQVGRYLSVDASGSTLGGNSTAFRGSVNPALVFTGTFTADALTQTFTAEVFTPGNVSVGTQLNAFQLRATAVPEPSSLVLLGIGLLVTNRRRRKI